MYYLYVFVWIRQCIEDMIKPVPTPASFNFQEASLQAAVHVKDANLLSFSFKKSMTNEYSFFSIIPKYFMHKSF